MKQTAKWKAFHEGLEEVKTYVGVHGRLPPRREKASKAKISLRTWLDFKRKQYECGTLPSEMAAALDEALGEVCRARQWPSFEEMLDRLKVFQQSRGRLPQQKETDADGLRIGNWINTQRMAYKNGKLGAERIAALEVVPGWAWSVQKHTADEVWLDIIRAFEKAYGRLPRKTETWDGMTVGRWVSHKRHSYKRGLLSQQQIAACEDLPGWVWAMHLKRCGKVPFDAGLAILKQYVGINGRLPSTLQVGDEPMRLHLGNWLGNCRRRKRRGQLSPDQIAALEEVPGWWWECPRPFRLY